MLKELFKKQVVISSINRVEDTDWLQFSTRVSACTSTLTKGAVNDLIDKTINDDYVLDKGSKVYVLPGSELPRFKLKAFIDAEGMSMTKASSNATVIVAGDDCEKEMFTRTTDYSINKDELSRFLDKEYGFGSSNTVALKAMLDSEDIMDDVAVCYDLRYKIHLSPLINYDCRTKSYLSTDEKVLNTLDHIIENNIPIVSTKYMLKKINPLSMVINEEMHSELMRMFESEDDNNHVLAMELMANCNYEKSSIYLLHVYSKKRYIIRERKEKNHVNFKAFLKFFNLDPVRGYDLDDIIKTLMDRNLLRKGEYSVLLNLAKEQIEDDIGAIGRFFTVDTINPSEELSLAIEKAEALLPPTQPATTETDNVDA